MNYFNFFQKRKIAQTHIEMEVLICHVILKQHELWGYPILRINIVKVWIPSA